MAGGSGVASNTARSAVETTRGRAVPTLCAASTSTMSAPLEWRSLAKVSNSSARSGACSRLRPLGGDQVENCSIGGPLHVDARLRNIEGNKPDIEIVGQVPIVPPAFAEKSRWER